ncbi:MAG TPA: inositol monophosphatase family protein, partial [Armatimonadota bacterium]|nr:inositol monophosphatase family protein [Armatimonadota bacterium]
MPEMLEVAIAAAREAGARQREGLRQPIEVLEVRRHDIKLAMDVACEDAIRRRIAEAFPDHAVLGEEAGGAVSPDAPTWIIDPLDGTVNYLYGFPSWAVSVGVLIDDRPAVGVVHAPALATVWRGVADDFAEANGRPIRCGGATEVSAALVATGFGYDPAVRAVQGVQVAALLPQIRDIRRAGAA